MSRKGKTTMWKRTALIVAGLIVVAGLNASCIFDPEKTPGDVEPPPPPSYKNLTVKDDVLFNLELLFPQLDYTEYNRLLDDEDYVFFFGGNDGGNFTELTKQQELQTMRNMADDTREDAILGIDLSLDYAEGEWTAIIPQDPEYADETWYQKTVTYNFSIQAQPDNTYIADGIKAQFTIRQGKDLDGTTDIWRIIRWRDDIEGTTP